MDDNIAGRCAGCGKPLDSNLPSWINTVNLTPDLLMIKGYCINVDDSVIEMDIAFDWCDAACFMAWCFRAAASIPTVARP